MEDEEKIDNKPDTSTTSIISKKKALENEFQTSMLQLNKPYGSGTASTTISKNNKEDRFLYNQIKEDLRRELREEVRREVKSQIKSQKYDGPNLDEDDEISEPVFQKISIGNYNRFNELKQKNYKKLRTLEYPEEDDF